MRFAKVSLVLFVLAAGVHAQNRLNPRTQIQWPACAAGEAYEPFTNTCAVHVGPPGGSLSYPGVTTDGDSGITVTKKITASSVSAVTMVLPGGDVQTQIGTNATAIATNAAGVAANIKGIVSGQLPHFLAQPMTGKHIWYIGNSTVFNPTAWYGQICQSINDPKSVLYGMNPCRTDAVTISTDSGSHITVVMSGAVTWTVGQYVSLAPTAGGLGSVLGTCKITAVASPQFTCTNIGNSAVNPSMTATAVGAFSNVSDVVFNLGFNGQTSTSILASMASATLWAAVQPNDLVMIRGPLINDVRQGACNLACATANVATVLSTARANIPTTSDILLKTENSMLTTDPGSTGFVSPLGSSALYSTYIHDAVMALAGTQSNLAVVDTQKLLYGVGHPTSPYMSDILHPINIGQNREAITDLWVLSQLATASTQSRPDIADYADYLGQFEAVKRNARYSAPLAALAMQASWTSCWTFYPECVLNSNMFTPIAIGFAPSSPGIGAAYFDLSWPGGAAGQIKVGDVVWYGGAVFQIPAGSTIGASGSNTRLAGLGGALPPVAVTQGEYVVVMRALSVDPLSVPYMLAPTAYPYHHTINSNGGCGTNYCRFNYTDTPQTWGGAYTTSDVIIFPGGLSFPLSNCTSFLQFSTTQMQCSGVGSWAAYANLTGIIYGTHAMEGTVTPLGTLALAVAAIAPGTCSTAVSIASAAVTTTSKLNWTAATDPTVVTGYGFGGLSLWVYPTTGNANFKACNPTASSITPGALTINVAAIQ